MKTTKTKPRRRLPESSAALLLRRIGAQLEHAFRVLFTPRVEPSSAFANVETPKRRQP